MEKKIVFGTGTPENVFGSPRLPPYAKINSKLITDLNIRAKTASLIGENTGVNLRDLRLSKAFLAMQPKTQATDEKTGKLEFVKIKNPCSQGTMIQMKRQLHRKKKLFANHIYLARGLYL